jgi:hypothetical protein
VNDRFGIRSILISVARAFELRPDISVVEDFAVVNGHQRSVFVSHRLTAARQIDNAEPPVTQRDMLVDEHTRIVRTAMADDAGHPLEHGTSV